MSLYSFALGDTDVPSPHFFPSIYLSNSSCSIACSLGTQPQTSQLTHKFQMKVLVIFFSLFYGITPVSLVLVSTVSPNIWPLVSSADFLTQTLKESMTGSHSGMCDHRHAWYLGQTQRKLLWSYIHIAGDGGISMGKDKEEKKEQI